MAIYHPNIERLALRADYFATHHVLSNCTVAIGQGLKIRIRRQPSAGRRQVQPVLPL